MLQIHHSAAQRGDLLLLPLVPTPKGHCQYLTCRSPARHSILHLHKELSKPSDSASLAIASMQQHRILTDVPDGLDKATNNSSLGTRFAVEYCSGVVSPGWRDGCKYRLRSSLMSPSRVLAYPQQASSVELRVNSIFRYSTHLLS